MMGNASVGRSGPCGAGQTCWDPHPDAVHLNDYVCMCNSDNSIKAIAAPAACRDPSRAPIRAGETQKPTVMTEAPQSRSPTAQGETWEPSTMPPSRAPIGANQTQKPTVASDAPTTRKPTVQGETWAPTGAPQETTRAPTRDGETFKPTDGPLRPGETRGPATRTPTQAGETWAPTRRPLKDGETAEPVQVTLPPTMEMSLAPTMPNADVCASRPCGSPNKQVCTPKQSTDYTCSCVLPFKGEDKSNAPATCEKDKGKMKWRWMGLKFKAKWNTVREGKDWVQKFMLTIRLPFRNLRGKQPTIKITYVCPLVNGKKPAPGTAEAEKCFKPDDVWMGWKQRQNQFLAASDEVFVEFGIGSESDTDGKDAYEAIASDINNGQEKGEGLLIAHENLQNGMLKIEPIGKDEGPAAADTTVLHAAASGEEGHDVNAIKTADDCTLFGTACTDAPMQKGEDDSSTWWIALAAIGGLGVVGLIVGGFVMSKKKGNPTEKTNFEEFANQMESANAVAYNDNKEMGITTTSPNGGQYSTVQDRAPDQSASNMQNSAYSSVGSPASPGSPGMAYPAQQGLRSPKRQPVVTAVISQGRI